MARPFLPSFLPPPPQSLMAGLMYHRPEDPIPYLQDCLAQLAHDSDRSYTWDRFVGAKRRVQPPPRVQTGKALSRPVTSSSSTSPAKAGLNPNAVLPPISPKGLFPSTSRHAPFPPLQMRT